MFECEKTSNKYLIILQNALHVPEMSACLVHPIMMRLAGLIVNECPKFLSRNRTEDDHLIYFPDMELRIPLQLSGIISHLPCRSPYDKDLISNDGTLELTPNMDNWDPHDSCYQEQEDVMMDFSGNIKKSKPRNYIGSAVSYRSMNSDVFCADVEEIFEIKGVKFVNEEKNGSKTTCRQMEH
mmetsp:Transcript_1137/g.1620  ORF Transcript_1137/g.1620 Transcript_1137/m.1620 type:complete len:182 (+) Transcript_1137:426-971(+)